LGQDNGRIGEGGGEDEVKKKKQGMRRTAKNAERCLGQSNGPSGFPRRWRGELQKKTEGKKRKRTTDETGEKEIANEAESTIKELFGEV